MIEIWYILFHLFDGLCNIQLIPGSIPAYSIIILAAYDVANSGPALCR